jgi:hypothetical protein
MKKSRQKRFRPAVNKRGALKKITLFHQKISSYKFDELTTEEKYCFLTLGHIHNEISWLQRMSYISSKSDDINSNQIKSTGNLMQAIFLAKLLLAKLFEFNILMESQTLIPEFIKTYFNPKNSEGTEKLEAIVKLFSSEEWIRAARNKHFLHYPKLNDVRGTIESPDIVWDLEVIHGKNSSNTFYPTSDVMANYAWYALANPRNPMQGFSEALTTIRELALLTLNTLEQSLGYFTDSKLQDLSDHKKINLFAESIHDSRLNYFLSTDK